MLQADGSVNQDGKLTSTSTNYWMLSLALLWLTKAVKPRCRLIREPTRVQLTIARVHLEDFKGTED